MEGRDGKIPVFPKPLLRSAECELDFQTTLIIGVALKSAWSDNQRL